TSAAAPATTTAASRSPRCSPLPLHVLLGDRAALLHVEAPIVDRPAAGGRALVLHEQHQAPGAGGERRLEVRIRVEEHAARPIRRIPDLELPLEDVPDLGEVVLVERMVRARLVADEPRVGRGGALRARGAGAPAPLARTTP